MSEPVQGGRYGDTWSLGRIVLAAQSPYSTDASDSGRIGTGVVPSWMYRRMPEVSKYEHEFICIGHGFDAKTVDVVHQPPLSQASSIETRCCVYRFYTPAGALLYVGVANDYEARFRQHADESPWWDFWAWYTVAWYPNRTWATAVEAHAIVAEYPAFNMAGFPEGIDCPFGRPQDDTWDYEYRWDGFTLNLLYGQWRRAESLRWCDPRRQHVDPDIASKRYEAALKRCSWFSLFWHDLWLGDHMEKEYAGRRLLESRTVSLSRHREVQAMKKARVAEAAASTPAAPKRRGTARKPTKAKR